MIFHSSIRRNVYLSNVEHTCSTQGDAITSYVGRDRGEVVVFSDYTVEITSDDSMKGTTSICTVETYCTNYYYSYTTLYCNAWLGPPSSFNCWTNDDYQTPQCVEPGNSWVASLVGCIIAGLSGISFLLFAWCLKSDIDRSPSQPMYPTDVIVSEPVYVTVTQPSPAVVPAGRVVQGTVLSASA